MLAGIIQHSVMFIVTPQLPQAEIVKTRLMAALRGKTTPHSHPSFLLGYRIYIITKNIFLLHQIHFSAKKLITAKTAHIILASLPYFI